MAIVAPKSLACPHAHSSPAALPLKQATGPKPAGITEKIDIYSLAMVLYECVTGHRPWDGLTNYAIIYKVRGPARICLHLILPVPRAQHTIMLCTAHQQLHCLPRDRQAGRPQLVGFRWPCRWQWRDRGHTCPQTCPAAQLPSAGLLPPAGLTTRTSAPAASSCCTRRRGYWRSMSSRLHGRLHSLCRFESGSNHHQDYGLIACDQFGLTK